MEKDENEKNTRGQAAATSREQTVGDAGKNLREAGSRTTTAQTGGVANTPDFTGAHLEQAHITFNINTGPNAQTARTEESDAASPQDNENILRCQADLKSYLQNTTKDLFQGTNEDGSSTLLKKIYTELHITEGGGGEVNSEHEVIEAEPRRSATHETAIQINDIFKALPNQEKPPQRVLTKGIPGIGKTVAVQKFTHDWAFEEANQTIQFVFPFSFRDLNLKKHRQFNFIELICDFFVEMTDLEISDYNKSSVLFILDGLDESKFPLDFKGNEMCRDITKTTSIDILLTNLINGQLLHKALVWITGRPAAANQIPLKYVDRVTEVRGFNDDQKKEYFQKNISDKDMAQKIFTHIKSLRSLDIMCHIPVFCWITATALESLLMESQKDKEGKELPKTLTEMYTHFLIIQTKLKHQKYCQEGETDDDVIMKLGKLAFKQLNKGNLIFYADDLKTCDIDVKDAAVYSGVCTQIIRKESGLHREEIYSFVHLSVQEFLAALYVLVTFIDRGDNLLSSQTSAKVRTETGEIPFVFLHKSAVDKALKNSYGRWDLFLRFLLGLSQKKNQKLLQGMLGRKERRLQSNQKTVNYIHKMIRKVTFTEKSTNLFHCLNELGDQSLVKQVQEHLDSGDLSKISPEHWSALAFVLLTSNEDLDVFELKKYFRSDDVLERLQPVLKVSKKALLGDCNLTDKCCRSVASAISSNTSGLEELDLSRNKLQNSGVKLLSSGLQNPHCKLQRLRLHGCGITEEGCKSLTSALSLNPSHLKDLDLSWNSLGDQAVTQLSGFLRNPACQLGRLWLHGCGITGEGCESLDSALSLNPSHLKDLDLSQNSLGIQAVTQLSDFLRNPACQLERLWLHGSDITEKGCESLTSALSLNPSHLKDLDLSRNSLGDQAVTQLSDFLRNPACQLERLWLYRVKLTEQGGAALASALSSNPSHLMKLNLGANYLRDTVVTEISVLLKDPNCKLETLRLDFCSFTKGCSQSLTLALSFSALKELDLRYNKLEDQGVELLSDWLRRPQCRLEILRLSFCTERSCGSLASALRSNPHLRELELSRSDPGESGLKLLSDLKKDPQCKLQTLTVL
ncbi:NLR family CARD domain-containing protein 3-like isoform X2 [Centroberyx affinis]|uniref:NLR family CARD domain-containing protein 3-like isoform X2 n=1 Tax=Centroberyx affinis TaxID=166261 RepID=UPI003A5B96AC